MSSDLKPIRKRRSVLISGASIAGPATAYWLARYGFDVTVAERSPSIRLGGYPIDIRGTALEVVDRMGIEPQLRDAHIDTRKIRFATGDGIPIATLAPEALSGGVAGRDLEVPRGTLTSALFELSRPSVRYMFGDSIEALHDDGDSVEVRLQSGETQRFDIVIGADGMHSNTRELVFGPEEPFNRYLGYCFNLFSMPNDAGLAHEAIVCAEPGRLAGVYAVGDSPRLQVFLNFALDNPPTRATMTLEQQRQRTAKIFGGDSLIFRRLVAAMEHADDVFFDTVSQIHMPVWSRGRVVLVGDAAYAPSFLSGQGTSLALVGAYVLAGELAANDDVQAAFRNYEDAIRPFVGTNQALANREGSPLMPRTQEELDARNAALVQMQSSGSSPRADQAKRVHSSLDLPDYSHLVQP